MFKPEEKHACVICKTETTKKCSGCEQLGGEGEGYNNIMCVFLIYANLPKVNSSTVKTSN
eukprot:Pgem_evm1s6139